LADLRRGSNSLNSDTAHIVNLDKRGGGEKVGRGEGRWRECG